jgi:xanthine dehydrogenase accessory factor
MALEDQLWRIARREVAVAARSESAGANGAAARPACVICTVVGVHGSTPRETGAHMLVGPTGILAGTVGGGCGEAEVMVAARKLLGGQATPPVVEVDLSGDFSQTAIQACGGTMEVAVLPLSASDAEWLALAADAEAGNQPVELSFSLSGAPGFAVRRLDARADLHADHSVSPAGAVAPRFRCIIGNRDEVIIVGSGHVAQPLARLASLLSYRVTIVDDRPEYATRANFPKAAAILAGDHAASLAKLAPGPHTAVVIITRGHQHDEAALRETLRHAPAYVGMIGSKRRAIGTVKRLAAEGVAAEKLAAVRTPIGLDIGAFTPEEIALAILAEIVCVRRGGTGRPLADLRAVPKHAHAEEAPRDAATCD